jgi:hypothetical protein
MSILRTLEDVVIPAVDPGNSLAQEQCGLIAAQLRMLVQHMPFIGDYHALCRDDLRNTAQSLLNAVGGPATQAAGAALIAAIADAQTQLDANAAYHRMGFAFEALIRGVAADGAPDYRAAVDAAALVFSRRQARRERTWFKDAGFDPLASELPSLIDMVAGG